MMSQFTFPILQLLDDGKFHSGEVIAKQLGITRSTVWQALQHAESMGVQVYSIRGRGYKLAKPLNLLNSKDIRSAIGESQAFFNLLVLDEVDSTNSFLIQQSSQGIAHATCVVAQMQTNGRGRRGRVWQSSLGASLTFSLLWRFQCGAAGLSGLSLVIGVGLIRALHECGLNEARLKWPNDVVVFDFENQANKLAGILIELQGDIEGPSAAVIGIGINLNLSDNLCRLIDQPAIDVQSCLAEKTNPNQLLGVILKHLFQVLNAFEQFGFASVRDEWLSYHAYTEKLVRMIMPNGAEIQGVVHGIAEDGVLLIQTEQGLHCFSSGEISLRGVI